jgi:hypothetical protein
MANAKGSTAKGNSALAEKDVPSWSCAADSLYRCAAECCRQQARIGHVLDLKCNDEELEAVIETSVLAVRHLSEAGERYSALAPDGERDGPTWHAANALWQASREYTRRHHACNVRSAKLSRHSPAQLGELAIDYELKASSVLALRYAVEQYQKMRPEAV